MITQNLGVYSTIGGYYFSNDFKDTTANTDSLNTGYGIQSLSLGVSYYFK